MSAIVYARSPQEIARARSHDPETSAAPKAWNSRFQQGARSQPMPIHIEDGVIRDPSIKDLNSFRVIFNNRLCSPNFNSKGAAAAYLNMLHEGRRKPEYASLLHASITADARFIA